VTTGSQLPGPRGPPTACAKLQANGFRRDSAWSDDPTDTSRAAYYDVKDLAPLRGRWRTPGLRDVAITAPYMHTGRYPTLREVVRHYNEGGVDPAGRDPKVVPLGLGDADLDDLVAFMESLTGAPLPEALLSTSGVPPSTF
jgi:cytochrome c peroxidase